MVIKWNINQFDPETNKLCSLAWLHIITSYYLPNSPTRDADTLDDADADLSHEDKEEGHEVEGTVAPVKNTRIKKKKRFYIFPQYFF